MSVDPLTEEYDTWSPYVFSGNRVIDSRELEGLEPYVLFNTQREAAKDFSKRYNINSIIDKVEYGTRIYKQKNSKGKSFFGYTFPAQGKTSGITYSGLTSIPKNSIETAVAHTHGNYSQGVYEDNIFSGTPGNNDKGKTDIGTADYWKIDFYLSTPNASFYEYDYKSMHISNLDGDDIQADPLDPTFELYCNIPVNSENYTNDYFTSDQAKDYNKGNDNVTTEKINAYHDKFKPELNTIEWEEKK